MIFKKAKHIKRISSLNVYDDKTYINKTFIYRFVEVNAISNQCEKCFFNKFKELGCGDAPCGFPYSNKGKRKDKKIGYFEFISDLQGGIVDSFHRHVNYLTKQNKELQRPSNGKSVNFCAGKKVYLSGPMSILIEAGREDEVIEMFRVAEMNLKNFGFEVVNPFNNGVDKNEPWIKHILADLALLDPCDCICYLHTWDLMQSSGSEMEKIVARKDKKIEIREELNEGNYRYILL